MNKKIFIILLSVFPMVLQAQYKTDLKRLEYLYLNNLNADALKLADSLLLVYKDSVMLHFYAAQTNRALLNNSKAIRHYEFINAKANALNVEGELGKLYFVEGRNAAAIRVFEKLVKQDSLNYQNYVYLVKLYLKTLQWSKANTLAVKCIKQVDSTYSNMWQMNGLALIKLKQTDLAKQSFLRAVSLDSTNMESLTVLAKIYAANKSFDSAIVCTEKAIALDTMDIDNYKLLGEIQIMRNHLFRAIPPLQKAYQLGDSTIELMQKIGLCYHSTQRYQQALGYLLKAYQADTSLYLTNHYVGMNYYALNKQDSAIYYFAKAVDSQTGEIFKMGDSYGMIAEAFRKKKEYNKAINLYSNECMNRYIENWEYKLAIIYDEDLKDQEKALELYQNFLVYNREPTRETNFAAHRIARLKEEIFLKGKDKKK